MPEMCIRAHPPAPRPRAPEFGDIQEAPGLASSRSFFFSYQLYNICNQSDGRLSPSLAEFSDIQEASELAGKIRLRDSWKAMFTRPYSPMLTVGGGAVDRSQIVAGAGALLGRNVSLEQLRSGGACRGKDCGFIACTASHRRQAGRPLALLSPRLPPPSAPTLPGAGHVHDCHAAAVSPGLGVQGLGAGRWGGGGMGPGARERAVLMSMCGTAVELMTKLLTIFVCLQVDGHQCHHVL